jgi:hypothetical protein
VHLQFTRTNVELIILLKKIEERRAVDAAGSARV